MKTTRKVQTFIDNCLRRILKIKWPETFSNVEIWQRTTQETIEIEIKRKRWGWIGHTLREPTSSITRQALSWNHHGKRKRGRLKQFHEKRPHNRHRVSGVQLERDREDGPG